MSLKQFAVIPIIIGVLAFLIQVVDQLLAPMMPPATNVGFSWICFQSWAVYFFSGCTLKGGIKAFISYALGIIVSILIMTMGGAMSPILGFCAVPLAVGIMACAAIFLERNEWTSCIPALFIGAGAFFAFMNYVPGATFGNAAFTIMVYCFIGLLFGFITIFFRSKYEEKVKSGK
ncbi:hypothetical protein M2459_000357 [Parabacteroides sp. PF5-5]|uniref:DUF1097 domain-containing protein n=1 Tax=unclassified Parabacteroides TaxID=2649774 RepID=UPI00247530B7|nr:MULTISPECIES: DUF1097 domain-containing protein [unclassified Parabacteroides]MDH6306370.1 hypothetical protein [Parabacteroides sp. PH5-39]MDH6314642.1 hypothetical protein [Parabacteroides sp. PF5-13]MDH6321081.1 hypothetical protein [Parabacteroides sp. PH5-13]MDH6324813.1 hypothetical protein [Parabacteroides sp. PH5-8]MDH6325506.1 hypothetical protein [Parabacteroides sp. PH5-41]